MAAIDNLIEQIEDKVLRSRLQSEVNRLIKEKKFGLVFEEHLPELTPIYSAEVCKGCLVALRGRTLTDTWRVLSVSNGKAHCINRSNGKEQEIPIEDLVVVRQFGEPIFPSIISMGQVQNGPKDAPWHILIEADNYHALQLLEYCYPGQVDCIYIDPPYNTGARDWKYNNDYVDANDRWRHSKWLAMMKRRLLLAKRLLRSDGTLIIAIDDNELAHLICLLEELFPEYERTVVTVVHNPRGNIKKNFAQTHEYAVYLTPKDKSTVSRVAIKNTSPRKLRRWGHNSRRTARPTMFYPIYIKNGCVSRVGNVPPDDFHPPGRNIRLGDEIEVWPIDQDGVERRWNFGLDTIHNNLDRIIALPVDGGIDLFLSEELSPPKTVWVAPELDAGGVYGSSLVERIVRNKFPYPKSLHTVLRSIECIVRDRPNALVVDFFAGSGTTLHAVNLLNATDGGKRRCILVTNNEVSEEEAQRLTARGYKPDDPEWEQYGICRSITWPRSKYTILGCRDDGSELEGEYLTGNTIVKEKPRSFKQIGFVDPSTLKTAAKKKQLVALIEGIPQSAIKKDSAFVVSTEYPASILFDETYAEAWLAALEDQEHIIDFYIVTPSRKVFENLKARIAELLGPITINEEEKRPMREGFPANLEYFKLDFLEKDQVALGRQFREILPILWLKAGAFGQRPELPENEPIPDMLIPEHNHFAVLIDETRFSAFLDVLAGRPDITHVFIVTDSEEAFKEMAARINASHIVQLYRDYLENFLINKGDGV